MPIHLLEIRHDHGSNVYACASEAVAEAKLYQYVRQNWDAMEEPLPGSPSEAIDQYFRRFGADEHYDVSVAEVLDETNGEIREILAADERVQP